MINKLIVFSLLSLSISVARADHPTMTIEKWLEKMHHAAHMINYDGTFVYDQNDELTSMQIIHSVDATGEFERLISLDGSGREVIRSGDSVTCILPDKKSVVVDKRRADEAFPPQFPLKIEQLSDYYNFHLNGEARVAGRVAKKLIIEPKDEYRYGHTLWIDSQTGLLLKDHLIGEKGNVVEQFMFTQINYPSKIGKDRFKSDVKKKKFVWYKAKEPEIKNKTKQSMSWKVKQLPAGFVPGVARHHKMSMSAMPVEHLMFSDGLTSISVFVEKEMENSKNLVGGSKMGAVNAYGRAVDQYHVTVVGEVPQATVKMVGDSVVYVQSEKNNY